MEKYIMLGYFEKPDKLHKSKVHIFKKKEPICGSIAIGKIKREKCWANAYKDYVECKKCVKIFENDRYIKKSEEDYRKFIEDQNRQVFNTLAETGSFCNPMKIKMEDD